MIAKAQQWGNSLAVRIPKLIATECGIAANTEVEIIKDKGNIIIMPLKKKYSLSGLLSQITEENKHGEIATGGPVGMEEL